MAKDLTTLLGIVDTTITVSPVEACKNIVSQNRELSVPLPNHLLACIILIKLPASLQAVRDDALNADKLPTPKAIIEKVEQRLKFDQAAQAQNNCSWRFCGTPPSSCATRSN